VPRRGPARRRERRPLGLSRHGGPDQQGGHPRPRRVGTSSCWGNPDRTGVPSRSPTLYGSAKRRCSGSAAEGRVVRSAGQSAARPKRLPPQRRATRQCHLTATCRHENEHRRTFFWRAMRQDSRLSSIRPRCPAAGLQRLAHARRVVVGAAAPLAGTVSRH